MAASSIGSPNNKLYYYVTRLTLIKRNSVTLAGKACRQVNVRSIDTSFKFRVKLYRRNLNSLHMFISFDELQKRLFISCRPNCESYCSRQ